jgi:hypothetical protein
MQDTAALVPEKHFPGVCEKVEQYVEVIEAEITASSEVTASTALSGRKAKSALQ